MIHGNHMNNGMGQPNPNQNGLTERQYREFQKAESEYKRAISNNVNLVKMMMYKSNKSYKDMYQRSYSMHATPQNIEHARQVFEQNGANINKTVPMNTFSNELNGIVKLDANPLGLVNIENSWSTPRFRFILEVESAQGTDVSLSAYIQGYTDHGEMSYGGNFDPNMQFHINSVTMVQRFKDPVNGTMQVRPFTTFNIIRDGGGVRSIEEIDAPNSKQLIRPKDIVGNLNSMEMYSDENITLRDATNLHNTGTPTSKRSNNDPLTYFSDVINKFISSRSTTSMGYDKSDILRNTLSTVAEQNLTSIPFFAVLNEITGNVNPTGFTASMLERIDPSFENRVHVIDAATDVPVKGTGSFVDANDTAETFTPNTETITAITAAQTVSSIMIESLLSRIGFTITNRNSMYGEPVIIPSDIGSIIDGLQPEFYANQAYERFKNELFPLISANNQYMIEMSIYADHISDTVIEISMNGQPPVVYRFPTFADSLYAPIVSDNQHKDLMTQDVGRFLDATYGEEEPADILI